MAEISGQTTGSSNIDGVTGFYTTQGGGTASTTPTITVAGGTFGSISIVVTNHASAYTNPNYSVTAVVGATTTVSDLVVDHTLDTGADSVSATMSFSDTNTLTSTRTVSVKAQEFGDYIQSAAATATYDVAYPQNRYLRFRGVDSSGSNVSGRLGFTEIRFYTDYSQSGTAYPTTNLTSSTSETGIVVSQGHTYSSTYAAHKACDGSFGTIGWLLGTNATNNWWQIHWEAATYSTIPIIKSMKVRNFSSTSAEYFKIEGSDTGAFAGEQTDYGVFAITEKDVYLNFG